MDNFARLSSQERQLYFEQSAAQLGLSTQIIEKDFWVCWSLKRLFSCRISADLTFKGGTSLSKVYHAIERFSEDVDVAIERSYLGFGGENEPEKGKTGKEQQRRIDRLTKACQIAIADRLLRSCATQSIHHLAAKLIGAYRSIHRTRINSRYCFSIRPAIKGDLSPYFPASVNIEMGARSDHFPVEERTVTPYMSDAFPEAFANAATTIRVLAVTRTFWEKATILHRLHHLPERIAIPPRMSRHYYDVFKLSQGDIWNEILG